MKLLPILMIAGLFMLAISTPQESAQPMVSSVSDYSSHCQIRYNAICLDDDEDTVYYEDGSFRNSYYKVNGCFQAMVCDDGDYFHFVKGVSISK